jgi:TRAP transporter TAXI family solute receptor
LTLRFRFVAAALAVIAALTTAWMVYEAGRARDITFAAGPHGGEGFAVSQAIADVVEQHSKNLTVTVLETVGTAQNIRLMEEGSVDLAAVVSSIPAPPSARLVAALYPDAFQLVARDEAGITGVADLRGKKIAIPPRGSGQHENFWLLVNHYGLSESDFEALPMTQESANWAMLSAAVDAVFRVGAPANESVRELIETSPSRIVPIDQAPAIGLRHPAVEHGTLPKGAYRGTPALPEADLETAVVRLLLVADESLDPEIVANLTTILFERRRDLMSRTHLAGFIQAPDQVAGTFIPVHPGAQRYYSRDDPSFFQENAEPLALFITMLLLVGSGVLQLVSYRKKRRIDQYNNNVLVLYGKAREEGDTASLERMRDRLMDILGDVVDDAEEGRVTEEGFNFFSVTWSAVSEAIRDRLTAARETPAASAPSSARGAGGWGMDEPMQRPESGDDA